MTKKLYDIDSHLQTFSAQVLSCTQTEKEQWHVLLNQTAFFPEGGGQLPDEGTLDGIPVLDVQETPNGILHTIPSPFPVGSEITGKLNWPLRHSRMQCHSGEHIISGLAHRFFGCTNVGFHMGEQEVILDFDKELSAKELLRIETEANAIIADNRPILAEYPTPETLASLDYRSKLDLTENVRIVTISDCDICACCAPHVKHTGEIGLIKLTNSMRHRGGIRLWMVAGQLALADYRQKQENIVAISAALSVKQVETAQGVTRLKQELEDTKQALNELKRVLVLEKCKNLPQTEGNLCLFEDSLDSQGLRALVNAGMEKCGGICAVFSGSDQTGYYSVLGSHTVNLREQAKEIYKVLGGKGGGQPTMIQGSVTATRAEIEAYFQ